MIFQVSIISQNSQKQINTRQDLNSYFQKEILQRLQVSSMFRNKSKSKQFRLSTGKLQKVLNKRIRTIKITQRMVHSHLRPSSLDYHTSLNHKLLEKHFQLMRHNQSNRKRKGSLKQKSNDFFTHNVLASEQSQFKQTKNHPNFKPKKQYLQGKNHHNQKQDKEPLNLAKLINKDKEKSAKKKDKIAHQQKQIKDIKSKIPSFKTFIGSKLRKKLQSYLLFISLINYSIKIKFKSPEIRRYTVYVGKGNNSKLIKNVFRNRFWWNVVTKKDTNKNINLVWSQWSKPNVFKEIPKINKCQSVKKSQKQKTEGQENYIQESKKISSKAKQFLFKRISSEVLGEIQHVYDLFSDMDKQILIKKAVKKELKTENIKQLTGKQSFKDFRRMNVHITHNHIENHQQFTNKKNLFRNLKAMFPNQIFSIVPLTFHVTNLQSQGQNTQMNENSLEYILNYMEEWIERKQQKKQKNSLWIVKPGQNSNRGCGIEVFKKLQQIKSYVEKQKQKHPERTFIIQKYLNPFLYHRRKFDIRCYLMVTSSPSIRAYYYPVGYIRTSSYQYSSKNCSNKFIHLTNDAIQKKQQQYGKYQKGNKVTYEQFQNYLDLFENKRLLNFTNQILPKMEDMIRKTVHAMTEIDKEHRLNPNNRQYSFELYGYDFMIDENFVPWLIEINTNPCLQTGCEILQSIIPPMLQNMMKICIDTAFPPPKLQDWPLNELLTCSESIFEQNMFKLIYDQQNKITK